MTFILTKIFERKMYSFSAIRLNAILSLRDQKNILVVHHHSVMNYHEGMSNFYFLKSYGELKNPENL